MMTQEQAVILLRVNPPSELYSTHGPLPCYGCFKPLIDVKLGLRGSDINKWVHNETCFALAALRAWG